MTPMNVLQDTTQAFTIAIHLQIILSCNLTVFKALEMTKMSPSPVARIQGDNCQKTQRLISC